MTAIIEENVKIVYSVDVGGEYKLKTADANIYEGGAAGFEVELDGEMVLDIRPSGSYLTYLEFSKVSNLLYKKAAKLAKDKYGK